MTQPASWAFPSITRIAVAYLVTKFGAGGAGTRRPTAAVLPYRMVTLVTGTEAVSKVRRSGIVSVHSFADSYDAAEDASGVTDEWMVMLGPPLYPQQQVTVTKGDGTTQVVIPKSVDVKQIPIWADYEDDVIFRFVGRYEICVGLQ